jgi:hydroxymethylglutaryl-CoA lyase
MTLQAGGTLPARVSIVEVGPRDGLQNEAGPLALADKVALVEGLAAAGLTTIETGSFVSPRWVPQMADSEDVFAAIERRQGVAYAALTPNLRGLERALAAGASEVAVFAAASEGFSRRNINCSIDESIERFRPVLAAADEAGLRVRGYVSCVLGCPYDGPIAPDAVHRVSERLLELGCYEVSLGDTIGTGTAGSMARLLEHLVPRLGAEPLALHCHDTYGQALANILVGLQHGVARIDAAVAGLGGCPYANGASGNVATEDVVYCLEGLGYDTGIDLAELVRVGQRCCDALGRGNASRVARALVGKDPGEH